jgi:hypothetical protein
VVARRVLMVRGGFRVVFTGWMRHFVTP